MVPRASLAGRIVLVTGAAQGIGREIALAAALDGARVALLDRRRDALDAVASGIRDAGGEALALEADVTRGAMVSDALAEVVSCFGGLDAAVNSAGIEIEASRTADADEDVFDEVIAVNLKGVFLCLRHEIRAMLAGGRTGAIVNIGSIASLVAAAGMPAYAASKHGVIGLTRTAAVEYAKRGIRVNAVCPGVVDTGMTERAVTLHPGRAGQLAGLHPMNRIAATGEVAAAALWLLSDAAGFVTGQALAVDGGMVAR